MSRNLRTDTWDALVAGHRPRSARSSVGLPGQPSLAYLYVLARVSDPTIAGYWLSVRFSETFALQLW